jgi:hypothetical protein
MPGSLYNKIMPAGSLDAQPLLELFVVDLETFEKVGRLTNAEVAMKGAHLQHVQQIDPDIDKPHALVVRDDMLLSDRAAQSAELLPEACRRLLWGSIAPKHRLEPGSRSLMGRGKRQQCDHCLGAPTARGHVPAQLADDAERADQMNLQGAHGHPQA